ncbi:hypothetical protein [Dickeya zeae]|uniref:hypothetical protein n=1 Tax=Dickeya zeae TaxID=204042 RepID=UPI0003AA711B|nr:hypothetical protein [Dickeya zeae]
MKERGMIFNAEMVRAILCGRKTQTRRIMKPQREGPNWSVKPAQSPMTKGHTHDWWLPNGTLPYSALPRCPYGVIGDRIWVRETCRAVEIESGLDVVRYDADGLDIPVKSHPLDAGLWVDLYRYRSGKGKQVPSIHMPRWASRITLEITGVRVERLHAITLGDICKEFGCGLYDFRPATYGFTAWEELWKSIYGEESWQANPWVWVIEFKRI